MRTQARSINRSAFTKKNRSRKNVTCSFNQTAALSGGNRGALWLPLTYLRRDATALGLMLLSMLDITSSFHKDGEFNLCAPTCDVGSMP